MLRRNESLFDLVFGKGFEDIFRETYPLLSPTKKDYNKTVYYKDGMIHNENGPAVVYKDGKEEYWLEGSKVTKEDVESYRQKLEDEKQHYISLDDTSYTISGKQYRELKNILKKMSDK
jgi:hypothetical protein